MRFSKRKSHFLFFLFYVGELETEKKGKWKRPQNPINIVFSKVDIQICENQKKWIFCKLCLTLFVSRRWKNAHFRAHHLFWPKNFGGPKQCKPGSTMKIVVSAEIAQNQKWHKKVFLTWAKKWVLLTVFWKAVFFRKHYFYSVFKEHSSCNTNTVCKQKLMKNCGLFLHVAKGCFFVCFFFKALMSLCFLSGKVARVLKVLFFLSFLGLCGVASSCLFGFGRKRKTKQHLEPRSTQNKKKKQEPETDMKNRKEGRKKGTRERQKEKGKKGGGPKKAKEKQRETQINKQKLPF